MKKISKYSEHLRQSSFDFPQARLIKNLVHDTNKSRQQPQPPILNQFMNEQPASLINSRNIGPYNSTPYSSTQSSSKQPEYSYLARQALPLHQRKFEPDHPQLSPKMPSTHTATAMNDHHKKAFSTKISNSIINQQLSPKMHQVIPQGYENSLRTPSQSPASLLQITTPTANESPYDYYEPFIDCSTERKKSKHFCQPLSNTSGNKRDVPIQPNPKSNLLLNSNLQIQKAISEQLQTKKQSQQSQQQQLLQHQLQQQLNQQQQHSTQQIQKKYQQIHSMQQQRPSRNELQMTNQTDRISQSTDVLIASPKMQQYNSQDFPQNQLRTQKEDNLFKSVTLIPKLKPTLKDADNNKNNNQIREFDYEIISPPLSHKNSLSTNQFKNFTSFQSKEEQVSPTLRPLPHPIEQTKKITTTFQNGEIKTQDHSYHATYSIKSSLGFPSKVNNYTLTDSFDHSIAGNLLPQSPSSISINENRIAQTNSSQIINLQVSQPANHHQLIEQTFPSKRSSISQQQQNQEIVPTSSMFFRPQSPPVQNQKQQLNRFEQQTPYISQILLGKSPQTAQNSAPTENSISKIISNTIEEYQKSLHSEQVQGYYRPDSNDNSFYPSPQALLHHQIQIETKPKQYSIAGSTIPYAHSKNQQLQNQPQQQKGPTHSHMAQSTCIDPSFISQLKNEAAASAAQISLSQRRKSDPMNIGGSIRFKFPLPSQNPDEIETKSQPARLQQIDQAINKHFAEYSTKQQQQQQYSIQSSKSHPSEPIISENKQTHKKKQSQHLKRFSSEADIGREYTKSSFEFLRLLGEGVFGSVYMVRDKQTKGVFALKQISKRLIAEKQMMPQLQRELRIHYNSCNHPNILQCLSSFEDERYFYLLLEFADGGTCSDLITKHPERKLKEQDASKLIHQLLLALNYLNSQSIIHRDIKLENILLSNGQIKLSDFGCATFQDTKSRKRRSFCGTIDYVSPEMVKDQVYDKEIDVWALGVIAYELVSGLSPFSGSNDSQTFQSILQVNYRYQSYFSENFKHFLCKIFIKDPKKRASVAELLKHPWISTQIQSKPFYQQTTMR